MLSLQTIVIVILVGCIIFFIDRVTSAYLRARAISKKFKGQVQRRFYPMIGSIYYQIKSLKENSDGFYESREMMKNNPETLVVLSGGFTNKNFVWTIVNIDLAIKFLNEYNNDVIKQQQLFSADKFLNQGILITNGEKWQKQRKLLAKLFHFEALANRIEPMKEIMQDMIQIFEKKSENGTKKLKIIEEMQQITGEMVVRLFFGKQFYGKSFNNYSIQDLITQFFMDCVMVMRSKYYNIKRMLLGNQAQNYFHSELEKVALKKINLVREIASQTIDERMKNLNKELSDEKRDFMDILIREFISMENQNQENKVLKTTKEDIIHQFLTFYFAGMETTANLMGKMIYKLGCFPDVYAKVQQEIDSLFKTANEISYEAIKKMTYCHAYIQEILRFEGSVSLLVPRVAKKDFLLADKFPIKKGDQINVNLHMIQRSQANFSNPDTFDVNRWLGEEKNYINQECFIPFSSGPRNCIGKHMAIIEAKIILVYLLKNFKVEVDTTQQVKMLQIITYGPIGDQLVTFKKRD